MLDCVGEGRKLREKEPEPAFCSQRRIAICGVLVLSALLMVLAVSACWTTLRIVQIEEPFVPAKHRAVQIERCVDRTGFTGARDLVKGATRTLTEAMEASEFFEVRNNAQLVLTCDIKHFTEGSALKRWLVPGWGSTQAGVTVMVWERPGQKVLATLQSQSLVEAGSLYTTDSDESILDVAVTDLVNQLQRWAAGAEQD
jgi:hypothetical protein